MWLDCDYFFRDKMRFVGEKPSTNTTLKIFRGKRIGEFCLIADNSSAGNFSINIIFFLDYVSPCWITTVLSGLIFFMMMLLLISSMSTGSNFRVPRCIHK